MTAKRIQILADAEDLDEGRQFYDSQGDNRELLFPVPTQRARRYAQVSSYPPGSGFQCQGWQAQYIPVAWIPAIPAGMTALLALDWTCV